MKKLLKGVVGVVIFFIVIGGIFSAIGGDSDVSEYSSTSEDSKEKREEIAIDEKVIFDKKDVKVTITGVDNESSCYTFNFLIENNSTHNYDFNAHSYSANGIMTGNNIYDMDCSVAAGKKTNASFDIDYSLLDDFGIDSLTYVDVLFWAYDSDECMKDFDTDVIRLSVNDTKEKKTVLSGTNIYDKKGIAVDFLKKDGDRYIFLLTNTTDSYVNIDFTDITFNDFTDGDNIDVYNEDVFSDSQIVLYLEPDSEFLEKNKIEEIKTIDFAVNYRVKGDYFEEKKTDSISVKIEE